MKKLLLLLAIVITSCKTDEECINCYSTEYGLSKISINKNEVSFKYWLESDNKSKEDNEYLIYISRIEPVLAYNILLSSINYNFDFDNIDLASFTFFTQKDIKKIDSLNSKDILGFQLYRQKGQNLITEIFKLTENEVVKIDDLTSTVNYLSTNDVYDCSKIFNSKKIRAIMVINNQFKFETKKVNVRFPLKSKLIKYKEKILNYKSSKIENRINASCSKPCVSYSGNCVTVYDGGLPPQPIGFTCIRPICPFKEIVLEEGKTDKEIDDELSFARNFRDTFMLSYSLGRDYVQFYYDLSDASSLFSDEQWRQYKLIKPLLMNKAEQILNNENENLILINQNDKTRMIEFVNSLKTIDNSNSFQSMISKMLNDINKLSNKSIKEVKKLLN